MASVGKGKGGGNPGGKKPQDKNRYVHPASTASWQAEVKEFDFVCTDTLRIVPPYHFTFGTSIKARWIGRPVLEIFSQEFPYFDDSPAYYKEAMELGRLCVNGEKVDTDYCCRDGDVITHKVHRHEPPISSVKVGLLHTSEELVVVDKPPSVPVHPGGRYRRNTLLAILAKEHQLFDLHTVHRLDRLTSGVMLLGRSPKAAEKIRQDFNKSLVSKLYLARVHGEIAGLTVGGEGLVVDQPIGCKSHREALHHIHPDGKPSQTRVTLVGTKGGESLVVCEPITGRTHQIRLHLQWVGTPISNDPLYGPLGVGSTTTEESTAGARVGGKRKEAHGAGAGAEGEADGECGGGKRVRSSSPCAGQEGDGEAASGVGEGGVGEGEGGEKGEGGGSGVGGGESRGGGGEGEDSSGREGGGGSGGGGGAGEEGVAAGQARARLVTEEAARDDETLGLERNGWLDPDCIHCKNSIKEGCVGYYVPRKQKHDDSSCLHIYLHALSNHGPTWAFSSPPPPWALEIASYEAIAAALPAPHKLPAAEELS